jgi:CRP/FNR family transcriptional regulator
MKLDCSPPQTIFLPITEKSEYGKLPATHQKIADDLGTAREVVSRLLKEFERKGILRLSRNLIELTNL